jgi:hypothetical protein
MDLVYTMFQQVWGQAGLLLLNLNKISCAGFVGQQTMEEDATPFVA